MKTNHPGRNLIAFTLAILFLSYPIASFPTQPATKHSERHTVPKTGFSDIEKWSKVFEDPKRAAWQKPEEVIEKLVLKSGDIVADIGAGTGYFTRLFAQAVGPDGRALGLEIEQSMVNYMIEDARKLGLDNYEARHIGTDNPELGSKSVDVIFLCNTYHHIDNRVEYFRKVSTSLKSGGRVVVIDFYKKELPEGPPPDHKISQQLVSSEFEEAGYVLIRSHDFLPYQYFLEFGVGQ
jgi:ubiquinone/menaquinone biosynthesis C-methylase UbiE